MFADVSQSPKPIPLPSRALANDSAEVGDIRGCRRPEFSDHVYVKCVDCQSGFTPRAVNGRLHSVNADRRVADVLWQKSRERSCDNVKAAAPRVGAASFTTKTTVREIHSKE